MPRISVIVPIYNSEKYLEQCINSILHQTYKDFELILVNDGSDDRSGEICEKYEQQDKRIRYIWRENSGVSSTRNLGMSIAVGEYITFVDSDDFIGPYILDRLLDNPADFSMCGYELYDDLKKKIQKQYLCDKFDGNIHDFTEKISDYLSPPFLLGPCFKLFKKQIIKDNEIEFPLDLSYGEDAIFVLSYLMFCEKISVSSYIGYSYRKHGSDSLSGKLLLDEIDINARINVLLEKLLEKNKTAEKDNIVSSRMLECFLAFEKKLIASNLRFSEKKKIFYEKYEKYKKDIGKPQRFAHEIILTAAKYRFCYLMVYLFKLRDLFIL